MTTGFLLALVLVLAAALLVERRRRHTLRGQYIGRLWSARSRAREAEGEAEELRARLLVMSLHGIDPEGDADHLPLPAVQVRRIPPA